MVARVRSTCIISTCSKFLPVRRLQSFNDSARRIFEQAEEVARKEGISIRHPPTSRPPPRADSIDHEKEIETMSIPYVRMSTYPVARERCHVEVSPPSRVEAVELYRHNDRSGYGLRGDTLRARRSHGPRGRRCCAISELLSKCPGADGDTTYRRLGRAGLSGGGSIRTTANAGSSSSGVGSFGGGSTVVPSHHQIGGIRGTP